MTQINLPILYSFRRCPYAMRARMALVYCGIKVELREVDLKNKPNELMSISPKATVPVLITNDGAMLDESLDIIHWAMSIQDRDNWSSLTDYQVKLAQSLIMNNDSEFKQHLDHYKYAARFPKQSEIFYRQQGEVFLNELNLLLSKTDYLITNNLTYVDIAIAPFIRQFANVDIDWFRDSQYHNLVQWLDVILKSNLFNRAMRKYPVWQTGADLTLFPDL